ncbi:myelin transcription factor 1-like isoform X2 [Hibiscus syriacus]|uniref:myelin transcription factor 1-like isoform X1 n=1 Tax=Hibiscus syriacus TaxID=106335 RepID=UPI0019249304|nr:myelin transcription factor 1-like isoform X1 [Hibiscus syriacus]XP_039064297.1 myelin transcription factor 1-like isoform X2 [Hibiscus syriacus]
MDLERPHRSNSIKNSSSSNATSELFICFSSRLSSSSMKLPSKSILSPGRTREPSQISLSSSLTRRLKTNGSMKGGQASPMFPTNGKKRGCAFENPEPSSPKVTCIGQVRVKTKKQGKKFRACGSTRRGEVSFRKVEDVNNGGLDASSCQGHVLSSNKKWVQFPMTICEALRAFGTEFNCFLPCRSSCMANHRDKEEKARGSGGGSCGAVCARWLVAVQEGEGEGKGREIELVVGGGEDDERSESGQRRHVFEDIVTSDSGNKNVGDEDEKGGEAARVSICIPPKNALLLMRCRSDPVKMAALASKFWETPLPKDKEHQQEDEQEEQEEEEAGNGSEEKEDLEGDAVEVEKEESKVESFEEAIEHQEASEVSEMFVSCAATEEQEITETEAETEAESALARDGTDEVEEEITGTNSKEETIIECQHQEEETEVKENQEESKEETLPQVSFELDKLNVEELQANESTSVETEEEGSTSTVEDEETETTHERSESEYPEMKEPDPEIESKEGQEKILPDCLLLMMCEPKLSMELSKETWVCSTDFIRCVPEKKKNHQQQQQKSEVKQKHSRDQSKERNSIDRNPAPILLHPPRSSCSFPVAPPMVTAAAGGGWTTIDKKLVGGKGYESFILTRCKSEPRRSSSKLAPDACFWNNMKLEPAALGVGAAGVGF